MSSLTPGSVARIYRDGTLVAPAVDIPAAGRFELRNLQPGQYELRDECGGSVLIEVTHATEVVRVGAQGDEEGPVAAADSTRQEPAREPVAVPEPIHPPAQEPADIEEPGGDFDGMTVAALRDALRERGEKTSGKRAELVARLEGRDGAA